MNELLFVPYPLADTIHSRGFDEDCLKFYNKDKKLESEQKEGYIPAPIYQQVIDWIRENYDIHIYIKKVRSNDKYLFFVDHHLGTHHGLPFENYYNALEQGIFKALQIQLSN